MSTDIPTETDTPIETRPLQGQVVPVDNRGSYERVQDACFEGLLHDYTVRKEWDVVTMAGLLWDKVKADRETAHQEVQTIVQNSDDAKDLM